MSPTNLEYQEPKMAEAAKSYGVPQRPELIANPATRLFTHDDHAEFYTGSERMTLQMKQIQKVRELQESNDNLQRQIRRSEHDLSQSEDPLAILAEMEHCRLMVARNTGEIMQIYAHNEQRLKQINTLEQDNINLQQELSDVQGKFIICREMPQRTRLAADFYAKKSEYEKNCSVIRELSQH